MRKLIPFTGLIFGLVLITVLPASGQVIGNTRLRLVQGDVAIQRQGGSK